MTRLAVDTSSLMAILLGESDAEQYMQVLIHRAGDCAITATNLLETMMVIDARNPDSGIHDLRELLDVFAVTVEPVTEDLTELAFHAWRRFGRGRHPAALNFGDCFAYALAQQLDAPLLFKGNDFRQTDVASALG